MSHHIGSSVYILFSCHSLFYCVTHLLPGELCYSSHRANQRFPQKKKNYDPFTLMDK